MTVIISRLYDTYSAASLESAGLPYGEISIMSSNADNWYTAKKATRQGKSIVTQAASTTALKVRKLAQALAQWLEVVPGFLPGLG